MAHRHHKATTVLAILVSVLMALLVLGLGLAIASAPAAAGSTVMQEQPNGTNATAPTTVVQVDRDTAIRDYRFANGSIYVTVDAEDPTSLTVTQAVKNPESKAGTVPVEVYALDPGTQTIQMPLKAGTDAGDAAVTLSTPDSVEQGQIAFLTPKLTGGWLTGDPNMRVVWAAGLLAALSTAGAVYYLLKRDRESGPRLEVERA